MLLSMVVYEDTLEILYHNKKKTSFEEYGFVMNLCEEERVTLPGYLTLGRYVGSVLSISET